MRIEKINWAGLLVENFDAGVEFFLSTLGLSLEKLYEDKQVAQFRLPSGQLFEVFGPKNIERKEKYRFFNGVSLGFEVDNLEEAREKLVQDGVNFVTEVESSQKDSWAMFLGPEKRLFQIQQSSSKLTLAYTCLYVSNISESVQFYRDILGLEPVNLEEDPENSSFYAFKTGKTVLALEKNGVKKEGLKSKAENPTLLQFAVESPEELVELNKRLESRGVKLLDRSRRTNYGLITNFCDPDGNKLEIICQ